MRAWLTAIAAGIVTFVAADRIDAFLSRIKLPREATIFDDVLLGVLVTILVIVIQHTAELRARRHKFAVMMEMNHHIRNALQTIISCTFDAKDRETANKVRDAASRIEWALREVLPAEPSDIEAHAKWPPVPPKP